MSVELAIDGSLETIAFDEFEERIRDGLVPADTLVRFHVLTGDRFVPVGDLEFYHQLANSDHRHYREAFQRFGFPVVTAALVGLQIRIYLWAKAPGVSEFLVSHLTNWVPATLERGEVYRVLSYGFLHLGFTHLALNATFLAYTGWNLERGLGRRNLLALFLFSVYCGGLLSMLMSPGRPSLGASGGDFGLLAASVVYGWKHADVLPDSARMYFNWSILLYLVVLLVLGWASPSVDNWGHLGGLLGGAMLVTWLEPAAYRSNRPRNKRVRRTALLLTMATAAALMLRGPAMVPLKTVRQVAGLQTERPTYWSKAWSFTGDQAWTSPVSEAFFVTRTGTGKPASPEQAADAFVDQLSGRAQAVELLNSAPVQLDGWDGRRLTVAYREKGVDRLLEALIVPHGAYQHRVYFHARADELNRYQLLVEKLFQSATVSEPAELKEARTRAQANPRSYKSMHALGQAAALSGETREAESAFIRAHQMARTDERRARSSAALLSLFADYKLERQDRVDAMVLAHPESVDVLVSAARAYAALGLFGDAERVLGDASAHLPGDFAIEQAHAELRVLQGEPALNSGASDR